MNALLHPTVSDSAGGIAILVVLLILLIEAELIAAYTSGRTRTMPQLIAIPVLVLLPAFVWITMEALR